MKANKKAPRPVSPDFLAQIRDGMETARDTLRREATGAPVQPAAFPGEPRATLPARDPVKPLRDPRSSGKKSMNSDPSFIRATFLVDEGYRARLSMLAIQHNRPISFLVNLALFNLLSDFEEPGEG